MILTEILIKVARTKETLQIKLFKIMRLSSEDNTAELY